MLNIVLLCQFGASTGMLAKRIEEAALAENVDVTINAYGVTEIGRVINGADIILLGPQMRFQLKEFEESYAEKNVPFMVIDTLDYGMMDGKKVFHCVVEKIKEFEGGNVK
ncbi:PTS sugar transporter subunit IIB [Breznakia pachnodae]|uniref:PTS system cellobiose-specific IIB component n=1 Tax=Breznakia pachnodae TaxID=265178 RepID=A0ABU0E2Y3_9FIRM|nr:PTS sugar transporter subunit IIB [Breznakia pachnodae]MDQ0361058.1 PTS system cellobiose-specific IIB component [Breznakia pachnodae]